MSTIKIVNTSTGEFFERDLTDEELEQAKKDELEIQTEKNLFNQRQVAKFALLEKLGITEEEAKLLLG